MSNLILEKEKNIYILTIKNSSQDNTINDDVLNEYHAYLDEIESDGSDSALILASEINQVVPRLQNEGEKYTKKVD